MKQNHRPAKFVYSFFLEVAQNSGELKILPRLKPKQARCQDLAAGGAKNQKGGLHF